MLQFLHLSFISLLLTLTVSGKDLQCRQLHPLPRSSCWSSQLNTNCFCCTIKSEKIVDELLTIHHKSANGADIGIERFDGGDVSKLPKIIQKATKRIILRVELLRTNTRVLNAQFFGNSSQNMTHFSSKWNVLPVEASAFQNCPNLENIELKIDGNDSFAPDALKWSNSTKSDFRPLPSRFQKRAKKFITVWSLSINHNWPKIGQNTKISEMTNDRNTKESIIDIVAKKTFSTKKSFLLS